MKRLRVILLFLLLGAIVNVAVAWGIALTNIWSEGWKTEDSTGMKISPTEWWALVKREAFGSEEYLSSRNKGLFCVGPQFQRRGDPPTTRMVSHWGDLESTSEGYRESPDASEYRIIMGRGWPWRTVWGRYSYLNFVIGQDDLKSRHGIIDTPFPIREFPGVTRVLPVIPIWRGFIANSIFFSTILWLLFSGPFALCRFIRHKRGLCLKCAYDLRGAEHEACPECGEEIRKANPA